MSVHSIGAHTPVSVMSNTSQCIGAVPIGVVEAPASPAAHRAAEVLTLSQVGRELNVHRSHVYSLFRRGELAAVRVGSRGRWLVDRAGLEEFIAEAYRRTAENVEQLRDLSATA